MNNRRLLQKTFGVTLIALLLVGYNGMQAQPRSGDWRVPTRFGEFVITVNSAGTHIVKLITTFSNYTCGGVTQNGTVITQPSPGWPISNNLFTIKNSVNPSGTITMTINGMFTPTGDQASGTWSVNVSGTIDSSNWGPVMVVSVEEAGGGIPERFVLAQNYPNPFNPSTTIRYDLPKAANVSFKIFNTLGQPVATLVDERKEPGYYTVQWIASVPSGIYFYRLQAGEFVETKKMILLK
jgi:hypothetical protein